MGDELYIASHRELDWREKLAASLAPPPARRRDPLEEILLGRAAPAEVLAQPWAPVEPAPAPAPAPATESEPEPEREPDPEPWAQQASQQQASQQHASQRPGSQQPCSQRPASQRQHASQAGAASQRQLPLVAVPRAGAVCRVPAPAAPSSDDEDEAAEEEGEPWAIVPKGDGLVQRKADLGALPRGHPEQGDATTCWPA